MKYYKTNDKSRLAEIVLEFLGMEMKLERRNGKVSEGILLQYFPSTPYKPAEVKAVLDKLVEAGLIERACPQCGEPLKKDQRIGTLYCPEHGCEGEEGRTHG